MLITNLREWVLVEQRDGGVHEIDRLTLADSEAALWGSLTRAKRFAEQRGKDLEAFLERALVHGAPINSPQALARVLAVYAREGLRRAETATRTTGLDAIRAAFSEAFGFEVRNDRGEHFFRSSVIQTLFYGAFSAWVWSNRSPTSDHHRFDWRSADWLLNQRAIAVLYEHVARPGPMGDLNLVDVLDWAAAALNRVERSAFFDGFSHSEAVQYFYEPFLAEFDPTLRTELGVWYTPPEIVRYMVERVDRLLRSELGIERGLADPSVVVLDPCCGTGSYLLEVLRRIHATEVEEGHGALAQEAVRVAAATRVAGFEIMPAPFVVAHMQVALLLRDLGAAVSADDRPAIYLTNALTGWDAPDEVRDAQFQMHLASFKELLDERDQARAIKRERRVIVVLGNPPYNAFAGVAVETPDLVAPYKQGLTSDWQLKKYNLDDLYVRFFRIAERRIAEQTGEGVVAFISNYSYLSHPSFVVMRQHLIESFDSIWIDDLNGDRFATGKRTPDGTPDPSVFSTPLNKAGIEVGTAIGIFVRQQNHDSASGSIRYRAFWGASKRADLLASLDEPTGEHYSSVQSDRRAAYSLRPTAAGNEWHTWPTIVDLAQFSSLGALENRHGAMLDVDRGTLEARMRRYFDRSVPWDAIADVAPGLFRAETARFDASGARRELLDVGFDGAGTIRRYLQRPFDFRWAYLPTGRPLWNEPRADLQRHLVGGHRLLLTTRRITTDPYGAPFFISGEIADQHALRTDAYCLPLRLVETQDEVLRGESDARVVPNHSVDANAYLAGLAAAVEPEELCLHALAIGYSSLYQSEQAFGLRAGWPRIPMPDSAAALHASASLGNEVATLLDLGSPAGGVDAGRIRPLLRTVGVLTAPTDGRVRDAGLTLNADWGHPGHDGAVMPSRGRRTSREYSEVESQAIADEAALLGVSKAEILAALGERTSDIWLNDDFYWRNVPERVWEYYIGGYQVVKKWLSYRDVSVLGRPLTAAEATEVMAMARRLAALRLLETRLDANYETVRSSAVSWPSTAFSGT